MTNEPFQERAVYRVRARNLEPLAIYAGAGRFVGLRWKFECWRLDSEWWQETVFAADFTATTVPDSLSLFETLAVVDEHTGLNVAFDRPIADGGRGWYFVDSGESSLAIRPLAVANKPLIEYLRQVNYA